MNDSTNNLLSNSTYKIYKATDKVYDIHVCTVFLDVSKVFDKVWHVGIIFTIKELGIVLPLLTWRKDLF